MTTEKLIRMARDWQAIATREAAEFLGTPEGAARLVEAKRYGLLADALATQRQAEPVARAADEVTDAQRDVIAERARQVAAEGWTPQHDDEHGNGAIALAAAAYAIEAAALADGMVPDATRSPPWCWPWSADGWKSADARRNLVKAGALILAEIERLDRAAMQKDTQ
jgi:hypothetical protein